MDIGMLWFDNDKKADLQAKIARAARYYQDKYGQAPNLCFIHPDMLPSESLPGNGDQETGLEIRTTKTMLPNHFWIGVLPLENGGGSS